MRASDPLRIAHLVKHVHQLGTGMVNVAVDLAILQARDGHAVTVFSGGGEYEALLHDNGVQTVALPAGPGLRGSCLAARALRRGLARFRPDIVHAHTLREAGLAAVVRLGLRTSTVCTMHNEFQRGSTIMILGDRVIAVSDAIRDRLLARRFPPGKIRVVRNGTIGSPRMAASETRIGRALLRPSVVCVAGLYHRKGIADLIEAFAAVATTVPAAQLYLVGDGPDRQTFETMAGSLGVRQRVHFEGFQADPTVYLHDADVFVLASRRDPFPLVLPEAREAGCAIVATDVDGIPEALDHGTAGVLVPPASPAALAGSIAELLTDDSLRQRWQRAATTNLEWLTSERAHRETLLVYRELRSSSDRRSPARAGGR